MCFGGSDPPQAPNNAPTYSTDQAKAAGAAAEIAKDPTTDDSLQASKQAPASQTSVQSQSSGSNFSNLRM